jgi:hypothetical protein
MAIRKRDTTGLMVTSVEECDGERSVTYLVKKVDTEEKQELTFYHEVFYKGQLTYAFTKSARRSKYLCVGGPLNGQKVLEDKGRQNSYLLYNRNCGYRRTMIKNPIPKAVLVFLG